MPATVPPRRFVWPATAAACLAAGSFLGTAVGPAFFHGRAAVAETPADTAKPAPQPDQAVTSPLVDMSRAFRTVHDSLKDAVVNIATTQSIKTAGGPQQIPEELRKMLPPGMAPFALPGGKGDGEGGGGGTERLEGTGSGVIVSADGYILTNNHVVEGADAIKVTLTDGRELPAKVIGRDPKTDVAVVKIEANHLTYAKLGDSDQMQVGDWVLAFGSPFGFSQTMTQGIISAEHRDQVHIIAEHNPTLAGMTYENFLQTDAAINPGNSGGPLVNLKGEVIGINTAIASRTGAYNGIGFTIPSNDAKYVMDSLIKNGKVVRGYLGVVIMDVKESHARALARRLGYTGNAGVYVAETPRPGSPAEKGGLKLGDVVTAIDGKPVETINQLRTTIARTTPGTTVALSVFRDGKNQDFSIPVGTQPDTLQPIAKAGEAQEEPAAPQESKAIGVTVTELSPEIAQKLGVAEGTKGVVVTAVQPDSPAEKAGLSQGDVITQVQKKPVSSVAGFRSAISNLKLDQGILMTVRAADGNEHFALVQSGS